MYKIMPLPGKRAIIINKYMSTTLNNDKRDSKTFLCNVFKVIFGIYLQKLAIFRIFGFFPNYLQLPGIEPAILWLESRSSTDCAKAP